MIRMMRELKIHLQVPHQKELHWGRNKFWRGYNKSLLVKECWWCNIQMQFRRGYILMWEIYEDQMRLILSIQKYILNQGPISLQNLSSRVDIIWRFIWRRNKKNQEKLGTNNRIYIIGTSFMLYFFIFF